ncbi:peptide methionine sulfoxide reductase B5 [Cyclospora cayetanensis]|uniref:Peptide methionine sulfoxide reductase B5 n=2 Tax=Cyclospora cayetanensis TaxID=88456 RepID=A0A6P5WEB5_9EIME|nr:peptide methionine sulfoxide reductase B5 [Cyclospora cayetanensis]OEH80042.1 hypothetical protein cyc_01316 [Cyclospora cayetanensis]
MAMEAADRSLPKTDEEWRGLLTQEEYRVLRGKGTERAGTGEYNKFYPAVGCFVCRGCATPLFPAKSKFDSGCGWPAFDSAYKGKVTALEDLSMGVKRWEIICNTCGGHLGHVFFGERFTSTNERHCVNSISIKYQKEEPSPLLETELLKAKVKDADAL